MLRHAESDIRIGVDFIKLRFPAHDSEIDATILDVGDFKNPPYRVGKRHIPHVIEFLLVEVLSGDSGFAVFCHPVLLIDGEIAEITISDTINRVFLEKPIAGGFRGIFDNHHIAVRDTIVGYFTEGFLQ